MPGLAIESSAKGWSASTTTARFIGTLKAPDVSPFMMRSVSAVPMGAVTTVREKPTRAAFRNLSIFM